MPISYIFRGMLSSETVRQTFLRAANILDPEWINSGSGEPSILEMGLDHTPLSQSNQQVVRKNLDDIIMSLSPISSSEDEDLFKVKEPASSKYIDGHQMKRSRFEPSMDSETLYSILFSDGT